MFKKSPCVDGDYIKVGLTATVFFIFEIFYLNMRLKKEKTMLTKVPSRVLGKNILVNCNKHNDNEWDHSCEQVLSW